MDTGAVHNELDRARATFHELLAQATTAELRHKSNGTRWTNRQLLFHLLGFH
ncbi:DinB family protein [Lentzea atacamensis]|uniref:DinB family protein n=1 Tax=Lentzea atacamensis TaxID=531938 RepID=UPI0014740088|nr:DinB family protein [Lentzea atacamensis]